MKVVFYLFFFVFFNVTLLNDKSKVFKTLLKLEVSLGMGVKARACFDWKK